MDGRDQATNQRGVALAVRPRAETPATLPRERERRALSKDQTGELGASAFVPTDVVVRGLRGVLVLFSGLFSSGLRTPNAK